MTTVIDNRALNRARLERQWLTRRRTASAAAALEHLLGLQAQLPEPPYYQLWSRLRDFRVDDLSRLLTSRRAVRLAMMRGTVHLVTAADAVRLRPVIQPYLDRTLFNASQSGKRIVGVDPKELVAEGHRLLADGPLANEVLAERLAERWPRFEGHDLAYGLRCAMPLIQVPPRGVWGIGGGLNYASAPQWLGAEPATSSTMDETILRYLAAFGPAGVKDFQTWSGLTRTTGAFQRLRPRLRRYRHGDGTELFDLAELELPDSGADIAPILLGPFDNLLLSHVDRTFVISKQHQRRVFTANGMVRGTVLLDGFVAGSWKVTVKRRSALGRIEMFQPISAADKDYLAAEMLRALEFAGAPEGLGVVEFG